MLLVGEVCSLTIIQWPRQTDFAIILLLDLLGLHDNPHPNQLPCGVGSMSYLRDSNASGINMEHITFS